MITGFHRHCAPRLLALLVALGVALLPFAPGQARAVCRMATSIQAACCCASMSMEAAPQQAGGHDKRPCCDIVAIDQHQPAAAVEAPIPAVTPATSAQVVAVLPAPARALSSTRACGPEPAPDGPPCRVRWCSFKT